MPRDRLNAAPPAVARRLVSAALVCVGGGDSPPRRARLDALLARLGGAGPLVATLAGARVSADADLHVVREAGTYRRHGEPELRLDPGETGVWDGRYEVRNEGMASCVVRPLAGLAAQLPKAERERLAATPADVRGALPAMRGPEGAVTCPILTVRSSVTAQSLVAERFYAACGAISQELGV